MVSVLTINPFGASIWRICVANRDIALYAPNGDMVYRDIIVSRNSPRGPNGKLILQSNPHQATRYERTAAVQYGGHPIPPAGVNGLWYPSTYDDECYQTAYSSLRKKLHDGSASLGVTTASWKQSADMISARLNQVNSFFTDIKSEKDAKIMVRDMRKRPWGRLGDPAKTLANNHLEWIFGWVPLFSDVRSAIGVLAKPVPPVFVTGQGKQFIELPESIGSNPKYSYETTYLRRIRLSSHVAVSNPNLWMANRLGLVNPATIAWDVIPWSFVVGMFVNVNQYINSFTDWLGLDFIDYSQTETVKGFTSRTTTYEGSSGYGLTRVNFRIRNRYVGGTPPRPPLVWRLPELSWSTVAMAASLAVQQSTRVLGLLSKASGAYRN